MTKRSKLWTCGATSMRLEVVDLRHWILGNYSSWNKNCKFLFSAESLDIKYSFSYKSWDKQNELKSN